jgi:hypothetical protein
MTPARNAAALFVPCLGRRARNAAKMQRDPTASEAVLPEAGLANRKRSNRTAGTGGDHVVEHDPVGDPAAVASPRVGR